MTDSPAPFVARAAGWPLEVVLATGYAVLAAGGCVAALAVPAAHGEVRVGLMVIVVGVYAAWAAHLVAALCIAAVGWCVATAFLLGNGGALALDGAPAALRLAALLAAAVIGSGIARGVSPGSRP
ncbi:hypothetical protein [Jiangella sp. DSM 45060]|uniref:hypothetical protein n=1 Tax=Jiangella sp. DSM 45060 TaxID=1798224 RepID=UPI00087BF69B|nr:hypothetical protein [Jiangella sp. DSM 45060]SDS63641.1 hypothetical protein SAMN04515669_1550 [Jiangella sp. DSM 45060]